MVRSRCGMTCRVGLKRFRVGGGVVSRAGIGHQARARGRRTAMIVGAVRGHCWLKMRRSNSLHWQAEAVRRFSAIWGLGIAPHCRDVA